MISGVANLQIPNIKCMLSLRPPLVPPYPSSFNSFLTVGSTSQIGCKRVRVTKNKVVRNIRGVPRCSSSNDTVEDSTPQQKVPFGYSRKDVLLIGIGVTGFGVGLKSGLEYVGVDPLQAGNVVQLVVVLGMTVAWISTYMFRVASKDMTYAKQLRDYESKVMEKRLEGLTEAELQVLLEQVEEEKRNVTNSEQVN